MPIRLYDLAGAEPDRRFSPFCWRTRLALAHKGLDVEAVPWRFTEKEAIAHSGQGRVPVIEDGDRVVHDSWAIAEYLEERYADRPSLFGGAEAKAVTRFLANWTDMVLHVGMVRFILTDVFAHVHEKDKAYFRTSREKAFGMPLEAVTASRDNDVAAFRRSLQPLRGTPARNFSSPDRRPPMRITSCSAPSNGRAPYRRFRCWPPMIRWSPGATACSTPMAASRAGRRDTTTD